MKNNNQDYCTSGAKCTPNCGYHFAYMYCRKFDKTEQHKRWVKLFTMIDELDILREFISNISGDASAKLSWHKSRIPELEFKIGELLAIIMKRPVHQIEVDEYLPLADEELMKK